MYNRSKTSKTSSGAGSHEKLIKLGQVESVRTLLKITHLATKKSYLVIICPNSQEFTKIEIR